MKTGKQIGLLVAALMLVGLFLLPAATVLAQAIVDAGPDEAVPTGATDCGPVDYTLDGTGTSNDLFRYEWYREFVPGSDEELGILFEQKGSRVGYSGSAKVRWATFHDGRHWIYRFDTSDLTALSVRVNVGGSLCTKVSVSDVYPYDFLPVLDPPPYDVNWLVLDPWLPADAIYLRFEAMPGCYQATLYHYTIMSFNKVVEDSQAAVGPDSASGTDSFTETFSIPGYTNTAKLDMTISGEYVIDVSSDGGPFKTVLNSNYEATASTELVPWGSFLAACGKLGPYNIDGSGLEDGVLTIWMQENCGRVLFSDANDGDLGIVYVTPGLTTISLSPYLPALSYVKVGHGGFGGSCTGCTPTPRLRYLSVVTVDSDGNSGDVSLDLTPFLPANSLAVRFRDRNVSTSSGANLESATFTADTASMTPTTEMSLGTNVVNLEATDTALFARRWALDISPGTPGEEAAFDHGDPGNSLISGYPLERHGCNRYWTYKIDTNALSLSDHADPESLFLRLVFRTEGVDWRILVSEDGTSFTELDAGRPDMLNAELKWGFALYHVSLAESLPDPDGIVYVKIQLGCFSPRPRLRHADVGYTGIGPAAGEPELTASVEITVVDDTPPVLTCPADVTVSADGSCVASVTLQATATDNCDVDVVVTDNAPGVYGLGNTTVTFTAADDDGNVSVCETVVTVVDTTAPSITAPVDVAVTTDNMVCTASGVALGSATTGDNCSVASVTNDAPASYPLGATTVTWTVTDGSGNTATDTQTVTVTDGQSPMIMAPADVAVNTDAGACSASGVALGSAMFGDNCSGSSVSNDAPASYPLGVTTVTWTVIDGSGNTATDTQTVTVTDVEAPSITAPADATLECPADTSVAANGSATGSDNCGAVTITSGDSSVAGCGNTETITRTWTATDANGNASSATQVITVSDTTAPVASSALIPVKVKKKKGTFTVQFSASDTCGAATATAVIDCGNGTTEPVINGQVVKLELKKKKCKVKYEGDDDDDDDDDAQGMLKIKGPNPHLVVTVADACGNPATSIAAPAFAGDDDDDDDDDGK